MRVKKFLTLTLLATLAMIAAGCFMLLGGCAAHEHNFGEWTYAEGSAPDCTHEGIEKRVCAECGEEETRTAAALGHDWGGYTGIGGGMHERACQRENCGVTERGDCDFEKWTYAGTNANGRRIHTAECKFGCGQTATENCEHDSVTVDPECEKPGYTLHTCTLCGDKFTDGETPARNHEWSTYKHIEKDGTHYHYRTCVICRTDETEEECVLAPQTTDPTCDAAGYTTYTCNLCGNSFTGNETKKLEHAWSGWSHHEESGVHYRKCNRDGCLATESAKCEYDSLVTHPTCDEGGFTTYTCKDCKDSYQDDFTDPAGHVWGAYEHNPGGNTHFRRCLTNPEHKSVSEDCVFTVQTIDATCEEDGKTIHSCSFCDNSYEEKGETATGHSYDSKWQYAGVNAEGHDYHHRFCLVCSEEQTDECKIVTSSQAATCTEPEKDIELCEICLHGDEAAGDEPAFGHKYGGWQQGMRDGTPYHFRVCENNPEHREEADCKFTAHTVDPDCTHGGTITYTCPECEYSYTEEFGSPAGHIWGGWILDSEHTTHSHSCNVCGESVTDQCQFRILSVTDPTCDDIGYTTYICDICKDTYNENYKEALGHSYIKATYQGVVDGKHQHMYICEHDNSHVKYEDCTNSNPVVTEPTCQLAGYTTFTCDICREQYTDFPTPATGKHKWSEWKKTENPTGGDAAFYCHTHTCLNPGCTASETVGCNLETVSKQATCTEAGYSYKKCPDCQREEQRVDIAALGHNYGGYTHYEENGIDMHSRTCSREECRFEEKEPCTIVSSERAPTCNYTGTRTDMCEKCFYSKDVELEKLAHAWESWKPLGGGRHYHICSACNTREEDDCNYDVEVFEATCDERGYNKSTCRDCKDIVIEYTGEAGHKWTEFEITTEKHSATCTRCGERIDEAHDYSLSNFCPVCHNDGLEYYLDPTNTYYIVWHDRNVRRAKKIEIPEIHIDKPVREISTKIYISQPGGFYNNQFVEEVILPQNLKVIDGSAFAYCNMLRTVKIRNEEGDEFEPSLTTIGDRAFKGCSRLRSAGNLPATLVSIGEEAFRDCNSLYEIVLPETIASIGAHAFDGTEYFNDKTHWTDGNALYISKHLIKADSSIDGKFSVLPGTKTIGADAFKDCLGLTEIVIPSGVTYIGADAFKGCENLETAEFEGDYGEWTGIVFENDYSSPLRYVKYFRIDGAHDEIFIPEGTTTIPANTFKDTQVETIHIPASVTTIEEYAFSGCQNLKNVIVASGSQLTYVGQEIFKDSLYYTTGSNWDGCVLYLKTETGEPVAAVAAKAEASGEIDITEGTRVIADRAFYGLTGVTKVTTPKTIVTIGRYAFNSCTGLEEVTIGKNCREISERAFHGCTSLVRAIFKNGNGWLYRLISFPVYRGVDVNLRDEAAAAQYLRNESVFEIKKLF